MTLSLASSLDPRRHAYREDIAAESLRGYVEAPRYVQGVRRQVVRPAAPMRQRPLASAGLTNEALFGEIVIVYDEASGWAWGQLERDGYVGYLPADNLSPDVLRSTHRVKAIGTFLYPMPDVQAPPLAHLSLNVGLAVADSNAQFTRLTGGGFVVTRHVGEIGLYDRDFVDIAERFIGTPYLWGGRTRVGLDCSGLVQLALEACGHHCPRDSDMQQAELGSEVLVPKRLDGLQRSDLVFWKGHVAIMIDSVMMIHANSHHMAVAVEPLKEAVARVARTGRSPVAVRRLTR